MPARVIVRMDGAKDAVVAVGRIARTMRSGDTVTRVGDQLSREARRVLSVLTPRQTHRRQPPTSRGFPPLWKGWEIEVTERVRRSRYAALVTNKAEDNPAGQAILYSLEGGARPHAILPVNAKTLRWREGRIVRQFLGRGVDQQGRVVDIQDSRSGRGVVFAKQVNHPGHRPFAMVARAHDQMQRVVVPIANMIGGQFQQFWIGGVQAAVTRLP